MTGKVAKGKPSTAAAAKGKSSTAVAAMSDTSAAVAAAGGKPEAPELTAAERDAQAAQQFELRQRLQAQLYHAQVATRDAVCDRFAAQRAELAAGLEWHEAAPGRWLRYEQYQQRHMTAIVALFDAELTEPYCYFTYEYFLQNWPDLCFVVYGHEGAAAPAPEAEGSAGIIAATLSKVGRKRVGAPLRGYIAMLAVRAGAFRGLRLGQKLVAETVRLMSAKKVDEVSLETPIWNEHALRIYTDLGFAQSKFLKNYYLDGSDAVRLKLWFEVDRSEMYNAAREEAVAARQAAEAAKAAEAAAAGDEDDEPRTAQEAVAAAKPE